MNHSYLLFFLIALTLGACKISENQIGTVQDSGSSPIETKDPGMESAASDIAVKDEEASPNESTPSTSGSYTSKGVIFSCKSLVINRCPAVSVRVTSGNNERVIEVKDENSFPRSLGKLTATFKGCQPLPGTQCKGNAGEVVDVEIRNEDNNGPVGINVRFRIPETDQLSWNYDAN